MHVGAFHCIKIILIVCITLTALISVANRLNSTAGTSNVSIVIFTLSTDPSAQALHVNRFICDPLLLNYIGKKKIKR